MWTLADRYNYPTPERAARELIKKLKPFGAFLFKSSHNKCSYYIHFRNLPNNLTHKLRVSNHSEKEHLGFKWQLRLDGFNKVHRKQNCRYYISVDALVSSFEKYYARVEKLNAELMRESAIGEPA